MTLYTLSIVGFLTLGGVEHQVLDYNFGDYPNQRMCIADAKVQKHNLQIRYERLAIVYAWYCKPQNLPHWQKVRYGGENDNK